MSRQSCFISVFAPAAVALTLGACGERKETASPPAPDPMPKYSANITLTAHGIPHITADDFGSLGFGEGYVAAGDHLCNISHIITRAKGELSAFLGPGEGNANLLSDYAVIGLDLKAMYDKGYAQQPQDLKDIFEGYAAGFNLYLSEYSKSGTADHWCTGADWVRPITGWDLYARAQYITQSLARIGGAMFTAKPPSEEAAQLDVNLSDALAQLQRRDFGSNAWAIGSSLSAGGGGMLLANPHYPWFGSNRFWEKHLTVPGQLDAYGVSLVGTPGVSLGFNKDVAWSHTVSNSKRIAFYRLTLSPDNPMAYMCEGEARPIEAKRFTISVRTETGEIAEQPATMYFTHHGPVTALPGLGWDANHAYVARDANRDNLNTFSQWMDMSRADSMEAFKAAHATWNAMPWVNTIATSRDGQAVYLDNSTVGHLSDDAIADWKAAYDASPQIKAAYDRSGLVILDGSKASHDFVEDGSAPIPGTTPFEARPQITRDDYVFNANDSYWLSTPRQPLTGYSPLYGPTETPRTLRTRQNILHLEDVEARGEDGRWSRAEMQAAILSNVSNAASIFLPELRALCTAHVETVGAPVCAALDGYSGVLDVDSKGSVLFREWYAAYRGLSRAHNTDSFAQAFDPSDPVNTPAGLGDREKALQSLLAARDLLSESGIAPDAALGEQQIAQRSSTAIPMHGGFWWEGVTNMIDQRPTDTGSPYPTGKQYQEGSPLTDKGYLVSGGTSFIMALEFGEDGPEAEAFLTYGQSGNPDAAHYSDQTALFAEKQWRKVLFKPADIEAAAVKSFTVTGD